MIRCLSCGNNGVKETTKVCDKILNNPAKKSSGYMKLKLWVMQCVYCKDTYIPYRLVLKNDEIIKQTAERMVLK